MTFLRLFTSRTKKIRNTKREVIQESIASLERIELGGLKQYILIRGHNKNNPILLFLHGGPGSTEMPLAHAFQTNLEEYFTIVHWDQRGAGKSFRINIPKSSLTFEQYEKDTLELIIYLRERFKQEKIILVGHSWGSALGIVLVHKYPEYLFSYVGIGQVVDMAEGERISYKFVLDTAKKQENKKAIKQLEKIKNKEIWDLSYTQVQRKWLTKFGGWHHNATKSWILLKYCFNSPEYNLLDAIRFFVGALVSLSKMWKPLLKETSFMDRIKEVKIPVFFIAGRYDYNTPSELVVKFYQQLKAPQKELVWFEESAHSPNYEEKDKFDKVMIEKILSIVK